MEALNQKSLIKIADKFSNSTQNTALREHVSSLELANWFGNFFSEKIVMICDHLDNTTDCSHPLVEPRETILPQTHWRLTSSKYGMVKKIIGESKSTA